MRSHLKLWSAVQSNILSHFSRRQSTSKDLIDPQWRPKPIDQRSEESFSLGVSLILAIYLSRFYMHMILGTILTRHSVSSEILMVKVGSGDDPVQPSAACENCGKKEGEQQRAGDLADNMNQEDGQGAGELEKQNVVLVQGDDKGAGTDSDKDGAIDKESDENSNESDDSDDDSDIDSGISDQRIFHVHKSVLCKTSAFFQNATKPEWTGPTPRPTDLSDELPEIFHLYVQWLYSGKIAVEITPSSDSDTDVRKHENVDYHSLIQSYILGEKLMDTTFHNAVLQCLIECVEQADCFPGDRTIRTAYKRTIKHSPLRKLLVDFWVWHGDSEGAADDMNASLGTDFTNDLLKAMLEARPSPDTNKAKVQPPWLTHPEIYSIKDNKKTAKDTSNS
ncbi:hypothetical protein J4E85_006157 [Alternaria conjuncta]|uniref:uncharacterized protein n=1 Tax=Alternaria conjuncta TaxID=181017 RepID=UPI00221F9ED7|nr:uncharacterized protein J4E85_006157 [Alternaria conjuncta]KAI4927645.1 hypothetical protein J4E85_006157 [Alternaria conjuncta]